MYIYEVLVLMETWSTMSMELRIRYYSNYTGEYGPNTFCYRRKDRIHDRLVWLESHPHNAMFVLLVNGQVIANNVGDTCEQGWRNVIRQYTA